MDRSADLLSDYELLGSKLADAKGTEAAAMVRERRMLRALMAELDTKDGESVVEKLAGNVTRLDQGRRGRSGDAGASAGRSESG